MSRVITTWILIIFLTSVYMGLWYIFQPVLTTIAITMDDALHAQGLDSPSSDSIFTLGKIVVNIFILLPIFGLWFWGYNEAQREDYRGYPQYG